MRPDESAEHMITTAAGRLIDGLNLDARKDIDILFTNVSVPDQPFTGCGAAVAHRLGLRPRWATAVKPRPPSL